MTWFERYVQEEGRAPHKFVELDFLEVSTYPLDIFSDFPYFFSSLLSQSEPVALCTCCHSQVTKKKAMLIASKDVLHTKLGSGAGISPGIQTWHCLCFILAITSDVCPFALWLPISVSGVVWNTIFTRILYILVFKRIQWHLCASNKRRATLHLKTIWLSDGFFVLQPKGRSSLQTIPCYLVT